MHDFTEIDFTQPGWRHRQLRPRSVEELAAAVAASPVVYTYDSIWNELSVEPLARLIINGDHLESSRYFWEREDLPGVSPAEVKERLKRLAQLQAMDGLTHISLAQLEQDLEIKPDDQVAIVRGPVDWRPLNRKLAEYGQCLPHGVFHEKDLMTHSIICGADPLTAISANLPHVLQAQCGTWRDWVLGMTVVLADGTIAKCGSQAVKNVAGYDAQRLFIGARRTLAIIVEVILRTYPIKALPKPDLELGAAGRLLGMPRNNWTVNGPRWIQRTKPSDFRAAIKAVGTALMVADHASSTLWATIPPEEQGERFADDWVIRMGCGTKNLEFTDPTQIRLMRRTKDLFDPTHKLNPGEMGIF